MKPLTRIMAFALLLASSGAIAQQAPKAGDADRKVELESRLGSCDQTLRDIAATKRSIDASGAAGVTQADDVRARKLIGIARRTAVEDSAEPDLQGSATLKEILLYVPKLIDALIQQNPAESPGRLLADGRTRVGTVVDSAGLEAATHALDIVVDGLELEASAPRGGQPDDGQAGWKTSDAGEELAEMIKGAADYILLTGRNATLEQVLQSGLVILGETHSYDSNIIRSVTNYLQRTNLSPDQREEAASELGLIQEADVRIDGLHQSIQIELHDPAPVDVRTALTTVEGQAVQPAVAPSPSSEVEPPPSAEPELPETPNPERDETSAAPSDEVPADSTPSEDQATPPDQTQTEDSSAETAAEAPSSSDDQPDADAAPDDQVEASPADVEADQQEVQPEQNDGDQPDADAPSDRDSSPPEAEPDQQSSDSPDEPAPAVEPDNPPPPPDADAPPEEVQPEQPPSAQPPNR